MNLLNLVVLAIRVAVLFFRAEETWYIVFYATVFNVPMLAINCRLASHRASISDAGPANGPTLIGADLLALRAPFAAASYPWQTSDFMSTFRRFYRNILSTRKPRSSLLRRVGWG